MGELKKENEIPIVSKEGIEKAQEVAHDVAEHLIHQFAEFEKNHHLVESVVMLERNKGRLLPVIPNIIIPPDIWIDCPAERGELVETKECRSCPHFEGVSLAAQPPRPNQPPLPWEIQYAIQCKFPLDRRVVRLKFKRAKK